MCTLSLRDSATRQCILSHQATTCDCGTYVSKQPNVAGASWRCFFSLFSVSSHFSVLLLTSTSLLLTSQCFFSLFSASSHFSVLLLTSTYSACAFVIHHRLPGSRIGIAFVTYKHKTLTTCSQQQLRADTSMRFVWQLPRH